MFKGLIELFNAMFDIFKSIPSVIRSEFYDFVKWLYNVD